MNKSAGQDDGKGKRNYAGPSVITPSDARFVASALREFADNFVSVAEAMEQQQLNGLTVQGKSSMDEFWLKANSLLRNLWSEIKAPRTVVDQNKLGYGRNLSPEEASEFSRHDPQQSAEADHQPDTTAKPTKSSRRK